MCVLVGVQFSYKYGTERDQCEYFDYTGTMDGLAFLATFYSSLN